MSIAEILSVIVSSLGVIVSSYVLAYYALRSKRRGVGIRAVHSREQALRLLLDNEPEMIDVMGISLRGLLHESGDEQFLWFLNRCPRIRVRVLLLNPYSVASLKVAQREEAVSFDTEGIHQSYLFREILFSIRLLQDLSQRNDKLEVRFYDSFPSGMLLLTEEYCLFEPYLSPDYRRLRQQPAGLLIRRASPDGSLFYDYMARTFEGTWEQSVLLSSDLAVDSLDEVAKLRNIISHAGLQQTEGTQPTDGGDSVTRADGAAPGTPQP